MYVGQEEDGGQDERWDVWGCVGICEDACPCRHSLYSYVEHLLPDVHAGSVRSRRRRMQGGG